MGYAFSKHWFQLDPIEMRDIRKETGFSAAQVNRLFARFQALDKANRGYLVKDDLLHIHEVSKGCLCIFSLKPGKCSRSRFRNGLQIQLNPIGDEIVDKFFQANKDRVYFKEFCRQFSVFRPVRSKTPSYAVNGREAKVTEFRIHARVHFPDSQFRFQLKFLYSMMDTNDDGKFCAEDIYNLLESMMGAKVEYDSPKSKRKKSS